MQFANPASAAKDAAPAYTRALLELLGDRDPLQEMEQLLTRLRPVVEGVSAERLRRPERPGKWSMVEVVQHLADSEIVYGYRVRTVLTRPTPPLPGYDQDAWATTLRYRDVLLADALAQLEVLRGANLRLLRSLSPAQLARSGMHEERGEESVARIAQLLAGHDIVHLRQLARIRQAVSG